MLLPLRFPLLLAATLAAFPAVAQVGAPGAGAAAPGAAATTPGIATTSPTTPGTVTTSPFGVTPTPSITGTPQSQLGNTVGSTPTLGNASGGSSIVGETPSISPSTTPSTAPFSATTVPQSTTVPSTTVPSTTIPSTTISPSTTRICPNGMTVC